MFVCFTRGSSGGTCRGGGLIWGNRATPADGPKVVIPAAVRESARPSTSGCSGPTTTKLMPFSRQKSITCREVGHVSTEAAEIDTQQSVLLASVPQNWTAGELETQDVGSQRAKRVVEGMRLP